jgi:hypothetical protein
VYFSGNSEVAAWSVSSENTADSVQPAIIAPSPLERAGGEDAVYFTGNDEPAASSLRAARHEP